MAGVARDDNMVKRLHCIINECHSIISCGRFEFCNYNVFKRETQANKKEK